jgi:hypothetical protein
MIRFCFALTLLAGLLTVAPLAADPELAGSWIGAIDTSKGQMDIGLELTVKDGKLTGMLKTGHGDWQVTNVTQKEGLWTVTFKAPDGTGTLSGRIKDNRFKGDWKFPMADGTFDLSRRKAK